MAGLCEGGNEPSVSLKAISIPVGIAVARQRLQDHSLPTTGTKPDTKPPQGPTCRQQKTLAPAPPEPQCSAAELVQAPAPPLSAMVNCPKTGLNLISNTNKASLMKQLVQEIMG
ncbi:hypothetical protein ANN_06295 [Periplaneta americana]|uniref:Uncharacterized protein n=1 Tax=Periplaneta americana TaxID=6978 RepID=A0ABQ8TEZ6_PERAM|nr:hypothetical protein ANN_06295 [Periplaneta americana]